MSSITALAAAPVGLLAAALGTAISLIRLASGKARKKPEDDARFQRLQRAHGNLVEHAPLLLVLLLLLELAGAPRAIVIASAVTIVVARVLHAVGFVTYARRPNPLTLAGATLTYVLEVGLSLLVLAYSSGWVS